MVISWAIIRKVCFTFFNFYLPHRAGTRVDKLGNLPISVLCCTGGACHCTVSHKHCREAQKTTTAVYSTHVCIHFFFHIHAHTHTCTPGCRYTQMHSHCYGIYFRHNQSTEKKKVREDFILVRSIQDRNLGIGQIVRLKKQKSPGLSTSPGCAHGSLGFLFSADRNTI